jgi:hypothetical protein
MANFVLGFIFAIVAVLTSTFVVDILNRRYWNEVYITIKDIKKQSKTICS